MKKKKIPDFFKLKKPASPPSNAENENDDAESKPVVAAKEKTAKKKPVTTTTKAASKKAMATKNHKDDEEEDVPMLATRRGKRKVLCIDDEEDDEVKTPPPVKKTRKPATRKKKRSIDDDYEDDMEEEDDDDDEMLEDSDASMADEDDDDDEVVSPPPKKAPRSQKPAKSKAGKKTVGGNKMDEYDAKLLKDKAGYKPMNNPQKWPVHGNYVDPVGVDPTQGIVEGIVGAQVRKIGGLLEKHDSFPIRLQTACSGTDAPSIAMGIITETLDKMRPGHNFAYEHRMSCEIEPFKQAYIGRNFPGVPLFPDITKLTASDKVLDVYGRPQAIPDGNFFVAGTSCKDFSMLKTTYRQDIEDRGQSGETFLAAVEFLEKFQPPIGIFENVDGAPWDKMQEYITGFVKLADRNKTKAIKDASKKADADRELKFSVNSDGCYVAEAIPRQVGIRAGTIVEGIVRNGRSDRSVQPLKWSGDKKPPALLTLGELAKRHKFNLEADTLVMQKKARYCTHLSRVDTKDYGLPQTRNRKYLFLWRSDNPEDDLGKYYQEILEHLKTPLLHSMDAFLLPDTHDRIRCFREALRSGPGLLVKRERAKELDFFDFELSGVKDLTCHIAFRHNNGIDERSRWLTGWDTRSRKTLAPTLWPELFDCWNMRRLDMIDCFGIAATRDAIARDPLHHSFTWDISQNVTRAPFRAATVGVSGCVTPGGELVLPHKGRTVMGYEKLLLQGIPFSRLLLGPETEVQLSDLAGNAMSVTVISATMLAALCAPELRRQRQQNKKVPMASFALSQKYDAANGAVLAERGDLFKNSTSKDGGSFKQVFARVGKDLASDAFRSSILCTCETSGTMTSDPQILECSGCGFCVCHGCSDRYRMTPHPLEKIDVCGTAGRPDPHDFERKLRCSVPSVLSLGEGWEALLKNGSGVESYSFQIQQVDRKKGHWMVTYGAWEDFGAGRQVAEIRILIGRTRTLDSKLGVAAYVRCFAPAIRNEKPLRGKLSDSARIFIGIEDTTGKHSKWEFPAKSKVCKLSIEGSDPMESNRVQLGINEVACKSFKSHKVTKQFIPPVQSRNNLLCYHPKWKTYPKTIVITGDSSEQVNGSYTRQTCQQTVVLSALWRRDDIDKEPMFIFIRPNVIRAELDTAVISLSPSYGDGLELCELKDWIPENALTEKTHKTEAKFLQWESDETLSVDVCVPKPTLAVSSDKVSCGKVVSCLDSDSPTLVLCEMTGLSKEVVDVLLEYNQGGSRKDKTVAMDLYRRGGTRNAKRLSIVASPSLLKCAAEDGLSLSLSSWYELSSSTGFGNDLVYVPPRPMEKWQKGSKGNMERIYDAEESVEYYKRLHDCPTAFQINVDKTKGKIEVRVNPFVAAHRAAAQLRGACSGPVKVDFRLAELSSMGEPDTKAFRVPNSDRYKETPVPGLELALYSRQAKALTRMLAIEKGDVIFSEEERSEHVLPGIGWCLIARARKEESMLRGGVLGDAIGSGKTAVTIGLILAQVEISRASRNVEEGQSSATLIVVPPGLVKQWDDERKKFTNRKLKCITVDCTDTLRRYSVEELCSADMVIVPAGIIEEESKGKGRPYTDNLSKMAKAQKIPPAPTRYSQREAPTIEGTWIRNMASGPEMYVGNRGDQRTRDEQAYYGHCYANAIAELRQKKFKKKDKGVPIEYFTWARIVIDECHETLVTGKRDETKDADFKEKARRGAREFLGVAETDVSKRPLLASMAIWGLTGTPLLETEARVTELANLLGGTYITGACQHWRKEERESGRDLFLNQQTGTRSREYRCSVQEACHSYVSEACQRNRGEALHIDLKRETLAIPMTSEDGQAFLAKIKEADSQSFTVSPDQLGEKAGEVLRITASSKARHAALTNKVDEILKDEPGTKIIIFANSSYGGYSGAASALQLSERAFCGINDQHSVKEQNEIISWFRHVDATAEDRARPRVLLLSFEQAAGHNFQEACHNVIIYDPMYSGSDAVADASVEEQAVGRVMRQGQKYDVTVTRIVLRGPDNERSLDDWICERNLDSEVLRAATSNFD